MKKSSPAKGKYLNAMISVGSAYAGSKTKDPGTKVKSGVAGGVVADKVVNVDNYNDPNNIGADDIPQYSDNVRSSQGAVSTTPFPKNSPYKMAGMSWKDGQDPMSGKAAGKASPAKIPIAAVIAGGMILGAVMDGVAAKKEAKANKDMFNAESKYNADVKNREFETLAQDKKSKALEGFADRASRKSEIYASAAANTKF